MIHDLYWSEYLYTNFWEFCQIKLARLFNIFLHSIRKNQFGCLSTTTKNVLNCLLFLISYFLYIFCCVFIVLPFFSDLKLILEISFSFLNRFFFLYKFFSFFESFVLLLRWNCDLSRSWFVLSQNRPPCWFCVLQWQ